MSLDLKKIHEALADQVRNGIADAGGFTVKAFPSTSPRPCIEVWPGGEYLSYFESFSSGGRASVKLTLRVFLSGANAETEWLQVARLLSVGDGFTSSIVDAIVGDVTLGAKVETVRVLNAEWNPEEGSIDIPVDVVAKKSGAAA